MRIERASESHLAVLAELAARTFRDAFGPENTPADMEKYLERAFSTAQLRLELADRASVFLLAWQGRGVRPAGYAKLRDGNPDPSVSGPKPIELERLYVDREAVGRGRGSQLMSACLEHAGAAGFETLWLGVWEHNPRAIAFYRRWHFAEVGDHVFLLGKDEQRDVIMERPVSMEPGADLPSDGPRRRPR